jgi:hypothetical protein
MRAIPVCGFKRTSDMRAIPVCGFKRTSDMRGTPVCGFNRVTRLAGLLGVACAVTACGGGVPLMYPARTLPTGDVRVSSGVSGNFAVGSLATDVANARAVAQNGPTITGPAATTFAEGALVSAVAAPGFAPYVGARVGIGARFEGGLAYTGRAGHIDLRRSFDWNDVSLSVGLGVTVPIYGDSYTSNLSSIDLTYVHGYGADLPVLIGWQSAARIYMVWAGARFGYDHVDVSGLSTEPSELPSSDSLSGDRFYGGGVVGFAAGFRHVHAALELDAAYQVVSGTFVQSMNDVNLSTSATAHGFSLTPAGTMWFTF